MPSTEFNHFLPYYPQGVFEGIIKYSERPPSQPFKFLIAFYFQYSFSKDRLPQKFIVLPDGCVDLKFYCNQQKPTVYICGTAKSNRLTNLPCDGNEWFSIRFWPGQFYCLFPKYADEFTENEIDARYVKDLIENKIIEKIITATTFRDRILIWEKFLAKRRKTFCLVPHWVNETVNTIIRSRGRVCIEQLSERVGFTDRHVRRVFNQHIGISPKCFSRIIRLQNALKEIQTGSDKSLVDIALTYGFYDHAHFTHEFKEFYGKPPSRIIPSPGKRTGLTSFIKSYL